MSPHYQVRRRSSHDWGFTTPAGDVFGSPTRADAERIAGNQLRQDRYTAENGGPFQAELKAFFDAEEAAKA